MLLCLPAYLFSFKIWYVLHKKSTFILHHHPLHMHLVLIQNHLYHTKLFLYFFPSQETKRQYGLDRKRQKQRLSIFSTESKSIGQQKILTNQNTCRYQSHFRTKFTFFVKNGIQSGFSKLWGSLHFSIDLDYTM